MMWYLSGFIHFHQYRKEILFKKLWMSSFIYFFPWNVRWRKPTVKICVNEKAMNGMNESLQSRFRGIQGVKHYVVIYSSSFFASLFIILSWLRTEQCHSKVHSLRPQSIFLPPQGFRPAAKSPGGTLVARAYIKDSTYSSNMQSEY